MLFFCLRNLGINWECFSVIELMCYMFYLFSYSFRYELEKLNILNLLNFFEGRIKGKSIVFKCNEERVFIINIIKDKCLIFN